MTVFATFPKHRQKQKNLAMADLGKLPRIGEKAISFCWDCIMGLHNKPCQFDLNKCTERDVWHEAKGII